MMKDISVKRLPAARMKFLMCRSGQHFCLFHSFSLPYRGALVARECVEK